MVWGSNFDRAFKRHEKSQCFPQHCMVKATGLTTLGPNLYYQCIEKYIYIQVYVICFLGGSKHEINECVHIQVAKHNETVKQNRAFLNRLIDVTSWLGRQDLSLIGHDESSESSNKGNSREFTETFA